MDCAACPHPAFREPVLLEANIPVVRLWNYCQTQWRAFGVGLDYSAVYRVAESLGIEITEYVIAGIRYLEMETLQRWKEQKDAPS